MIGYLAGELMVRQHGEETAWTILVADVQPMDSVLEIGFGAGKAITLLAEKAPGGSVAGIDLSATMLKRARTRNAQAVRAGRVLLQQADAAQLPFADHQFDKVISIHSLYFWPERAAVFAEIFRVLKPGGTCVVTFSPGKVGETEARAFETFIEEQELPNMRKLGFTEAQLAQGPIARQFKNVAIIGYDSGVILIEGADAWNLFFPQIKPCLNQPMKDFFNSPTFRCLCVSLAQLAQQSC